MVLAFMCTVLGLAIGALAGRSIGRSDAAIDVMLADTARRRAEERLAETVAAVLNQPTI